ncbi:hypothetical protein ACLIR7_07900 [Nitratireductor aquimarinus]|uniref:glucosamine inositolphosphorylceramide transferase family protein n=1 Tax=Alphaproteobacteria TaxID=28211 RepID=UPI001C9654A1|nr:MULTISPECIES: hypothetical protein [Alphaproteobacteria]MBY5998509.1 hypothetical protein [Tritonibacter mobilis]
MNWEAALNAKGKPASNRKPQARPLRIGIARAIGQTFENWELLLIERLLSDRRFRLVAFLTDPAPHHAARPGLLARTVARLDNSLFARQPAYRARRFERARSSIVSIPLDETGENSDRHRLELDLVLRHCEGALPETLTENLRFGVWSLSHVFTQSGPVNWEGMGDVAEGAPTSHLSLFVETARQPERRAIAEAEFNVKFSAARNNAFMKEKSVLLLVRELRRLAETRKLPKPLKAADSVQPAPPPGLLTTGRYAAALAKNVTQRALKSVRRASHQDTAVWTLYSGRGSIDDFDPSEATEIPPTDTAIKADPFLFHHQGKTYLFYENYGRGDTKAHIAVGEITRRGFEPIGIALGGEEHLSFPFVFKHGDEIFMMPETHQRKRIEIWRAVSFPLIWEPYSRALEGWSAADSTLFHHRGQWWLFTNLSEHHAFEDHCSALYAFQVDGPELNRLVSHRRNPVVIGSATARNGGRIFSRHRRLYRPAQYNAHGIYGYGLNIMEIEHLDMEDYRETCVRRILPDFKPGLSGCHHFDASGSRYILDARLNA